MTGPELSSTRRRVVTEIIRQLVPNFPSLEATRRQRIEEQVGALVAAQIEAMPRFLALPYGFALTAFHWLPALRYGAPFLGLEEPAKASWVSLWSSSRLSPPRDFIKLIRSCALLAYFDHPEVALQLRASAGLAADVPGGVEAPVGAS